MFPGARAKRSGNKPRHTGKVSLTANAVLSISSQEAIRPSQMGTSMTSVSGASAMAFKSPLERLQNELQSQAASGTVKTADVDALSSALDSIDSAMKAGRSEGGRRSGRPSPGEMTDKINSLID